MSESSTFTHRYVIKTSRGEIPTMHPGRKDDCPVCNEREAIHVLIIEGGSEAFMELQAIFADGSPAPYKISINERRGGVAIKVNEAMWTPTLKVNR
jgi:hypothetical protein